jgi:hypothetical protein
MNGVVDMVDGVWMTKAELATLRRISSGWANRLIRRQRWVRRRGNDGRTHVLVPKPWAEACAVSERTSASRAFELNPETGAGCDQLTAMVGGLQAEVARLRAEAEATQLARRQVETERDRERQDRELAERAAEDARQRAGGGHPSSPGVAEGEGEPRGRGPSRRGDEGGSRRPTSAVD